MKFLFTSLIPSNKTKKRLKKMFPMIRPKEWVGTNQIKDDGRMILKMFFSMLNFVSAFKRNKFRNQPTPDDEKINSTDDYLRREKIDPGQLGARLKRFRLYALGCFLLGLLIAFYMFFVFSMGHILAGVVGIMFAIYVFAKGFEYILCYKQIKENNFSMSIKKIIK